MPRWLWLTLAVLISLLCWLGLRSPETSRFTPANSGNSLCPMPEKFRDIDQPLQSELDNRIQAMTRGDATLAEKLNVTQSGRWYRYSWGSEGPPLALEEIISHSANMHMVPANDEVATSLARVHSNDVVELDGWLIRIEKHDGWRWQSSLSRNDSGNGACELVYVCSIQVKP